MAGGRDSIWYRDVELPEYPAWEGSGKTDVVVIGGGMAGILTAFFLTEAGKKVILLEAGRIAGGQTGRTTAKVTSQHGAFYGKYRERLGTERMRLYAAANEQAIRDYRSLVRERRMDCDWMDCDAYLYADGGEDSLRLLQQEFQGAVAVGIPAMFCSGGEVPAGRWLAGAGAGDRADRQLPDLAAVCFPDQGAFHPLKFLRALLPGLQIYENSRVTGVEEHRVVVAGSGEAATSGETESQERGQGSIEAEQIVFACHYPFLYRPGYYFLRLHQERSYVLAARVPGLRQTGSVGPTPAGAIPAGADLGGSLLRDLYYPLEPGGLAIRPAGDCLIFSGAGHRTGEAAGKSDDRRTGEMAGKSDNRRTREKAGNPYKTLRQQVRGIFPEYQEICCWSAQDTVSLDELPYIGVYSPAWPDWYVATGFKKWGMSQSMIAARLITAQITGWEAGLPGSAGLPGASDSTIRLMAETARIRELFSPSRFLLSASASQLAGESLQVAAGLAKSLVHPPRCTHLGCHLVWNEAESSWDCPCHGSRFRQDGQVLDGPAQRSLTGSVD